MRKGVRRSIEQVKEQFLEKVLMEPNTGCWYWLGPITVQGYASVKSKYNFGFCNGSRLSYYLFKGEFDTKKLALHHCDNPRCVNPDHLYIGDHKDNSNDKHRRHRDSPRKGELNGRSKLSNDQIIEIRNRYKRKSEKDNAVEIAKDYGVTSSMIYFVVKNLNWRHV